MIKGKDISVVVQGAVSDLTTICLNSIRAVVPGAQVILSTWKRSKTNGLDFDLLVENDNPGADPFPAHWQAGRDPCNLGRQILSTKNGLACADRKYALKFRADCRLKSASFIKWFGVYNKYTDDYHRVFRERILGPSYYCRNSQESIWLYHPSDWSFFGMRDDLFDLFDIPLPREENNFYLENRQPSNQTYWTSPARWWGEQYIFVQCLLKHGKDAKMRDSTDITPESRREAELFLVNNFTVLDYGQHYDMEFMKYPQSIEWRKGSLEIWTELSWLKSYKANCDPLFSIPHEPGYWKVTLDIEQSLIKLRKHLGYARRPLLLVVKWLEDIVCIAKYLVIIAIKSIVNFWRLFV
jgi:hypothetical protein